MDKHGKIPLGILFASSTWLEISTRLSYLIIGAIIVLPGTYSLTITLFRKDSVLDKNNVRKTS